MTNATPEQIEANKAAAAVAKAKREAEQKMFRENPAKLAAAIAEQIRHDNHPNENPEKYDNGSMHWFQGAWGSVKARAGSFAKLSSSIRSYYDETIRTEDHDWFEVSCPTTGCIAGWATSLSGFPMVFKKSFDQWELNELKEADPNLTIEGAILQRYNESEVINVDHCYNSEKQRVEDISDAAHKLLDLDTEQRDWLFSGDRVMDEVLWALDEIASGNSDWDFENEYEGGNGYCDCGEHEDEDEYEDEYEGSNI